VQNKTETVIVDCDGASLAVPGPPPVEQQKSRTKAYRRAYQRAYYGTVSACLPRPVKEAFRDACRKFGRTQHSVLAEWVECWLETCGYYPAEVVAACDSYARAEMRAARNRGEQCDALPAVAIVGQ
jgi:hypothetical protein